MSGKSQKPAKGLRQVVVVHRNNCVTDKEGYVIKFEGPALTDPGLERLAMAVRSALRKEGYKSIA